MQGFLTKQNSVIRFDVRMPIIVERTEGGYWISSCPLLDVHSQGESQVEAQQNIIEALQLFFETCHENGTLDDVLHGCGLSLAADGQTADPHARAGEDIVTIPFSLVAAAHVENNAHQG